MSFGLSAVAIGGIAAGVGAVGGAYISSQGAKSAANTQAAAANNATQLQQQEWQQAQTNFQPYLNLGNAAINPLLTAMGYNATQNSDGTYSINGVDSSNILQQRYGNFTAPTAADAQNTPGYQFTLNQGLKATQNSAAARGLGTSGAALKGASTYATGLADSTYNDVYNRALQAYSANANTFNTNYNSAANNVNRLQGLVSNGQNAAGNFASTGNQASANIGNTMTSGANAIAAGTVGSSNALSGALGSMGNSAMMYGLLQNNAGGAGGAASAGVPGWTPAGS